MVLVDFKGGATFAGMSEMPHVSAVITNLSQELTLVDRMQDALSGEMVRRQELLREAGNYASIRDYEKARAAGEDLAPMPSLFLVVDEFSEMLSAKPEFIDLFVAVGRREHDARSREVLRPDALVRAEQLHGERQLVARLPDLPDDDWLQLLCVEAAQIGRPVTLAPGQDWVARQGFEV